MIDPTAYALATLDPSKVLAAEVTSYIVWFTRIMDLIAHSTAGNYWLKLDALDYCKRELKRWNDELFRRNGPYAAKVLRTAKYKP
jgi:hypothetical protein